VKTIRKFYAAFRQADKEKRIFIFVLRLTVKVRKFFCSFFRQIIKKNGLEFGIMLELL
jgi:hypothetical protein